jgi:hypothetical protein
LIKKYAKRNGKDFCIFFAGNLGKKSSLDFDENGFFFEGEGIFDNRGERQNCSIEVKNKQV